MITSLIYCPRKLWTPQILVILPVQTVIIYGNFFIPFSAVVTAIIWKSTNIPAWRRLIFIIIFVVLSFSPTLTQLTGNTPLCKNYWDDNVCLQTSQSSCAAAAAATLLFHKGIKTTEKEMAELCLISKRGTYLHGLYRGLRIKTQEKQLRVVIRSCDITHLRNEVSLPVILYVKLNKKVDQQDPRYSTIWGWKIGVTHTVVLFGFTENNRVEIGDPGTGREFWDIQSLHDLWHGQIVYLENSV